MKQKVYLSGGIELTDENWFPSLKKKNCIICKKCNNDKKQL
jgi:hypothetical protein